MHRHSNLALLHTTYILTLPGRTWTSLKQTCPLPAPTTMTSPCAQPHLDSKLHCPQNLNSQCPTPGTSQIKPTHLFVSVKPSPSHYQSLHASPATTPPKSTHLLSTPQPRANFPHGTYSICIHREHAPSTSTAVFPKTFTQKKNLPLSETEPLSPPKHCAYDHPLSWPAQTGTQRSLRERSATRPRETPTHNADTRIHFIGATGTGARTDTDESSLLSPAHITPQYNITDTVNSFASTHGASNPPHKFAPQPLPTSTNALLSSIFYINPLLVFIPLTASTSFCH